MLACSINLAARTPLGMRYVQHPWWALGYFCLSIGLSVALIVAVALGFVDAALGLAPLGWVVAIGCGVHSYRISSRFEPTALRSWYSRWYELTGIVLVPILLVFSVRSFLWEPYRIPSESMYPTVPEGSFVVADKRGFGHYGTYGIEPFRSESTAEISRGDLVIFRLAEDPSTVYIRRVVAIPGDHLQYHNRQMTLNSQPIAVTFGDRVGRYQLATEAIGGQPITIAFILDRPSRDYDEIVPPDHFVMFGDNRDNARDSRYIGMISRDAILGGVVKIFRSKLSQ